MKKLLILFTILFVCNALIDAESPSYMVVKCLDGSKVTYILSDEPRLTFEGTDLVIASQNFNVKQPLNEIEQISYEPGSDASVENVYADDTSFFIKDNILNVVNNKSDVTICIYDIDGKCVKTITSIKYEAADISLGNLDRGVYILSINGNPFKIHIK